MVAPPQQHPVSPSKLVGSSRVPPLPLNLPGLMQGMSSDYLLNTGLGGIGTGWFPTYASSVRGGLDPLFKPSAALSFGSQRFPFPMVNPLWNMEMEEGLLLNQLSNTKDKLDPTGDKACDDSFFPSISESLGAVTRHFNTKVQWLLQMHLASGFKKAILKLKHKEARDHVALIQEGQKLLQYASAVTLAANSLLQEYDKVHSSSKGQHFKARLVGMHMEVPQSPWLIELIALYFNLVDKLKGTHVLPELCPGCICETTNGRLTLSCMPQESLRLEIEVTCSICLEMVFEPTALSCGHMFCFSCACAAASVHTYEGLKKARQSVKCPLCRERGVFAGAIRLTELNLLTYRRCKDEWKGRCERERKERLHEIKEQWKVGKDIWTKSLVHL
ncbi:hypothetical protein L7F22_014860 [Adiantum nelumboides]|nr:hypothetical protein [Adiantum nelumboides]